MRSLVFLVACVGANAAAPLSEVNDPPSCAIDSSKAVNEMLDSALFIWAAIERCGKSGTKGELVCSIDVSNVIKSVSAIIKFIIKSVDECSTIKDINHKCAATAFELTEAVGGLAGASSAIAAKCPAKAPAPAPTPPAPAPTPPAPAPAPPAPAAPAATPTCAGFVCEAPMTLRPQPERLECFTGACTAETCCLAATAAPPAPAAPAPTATCADFVCEAPMTLRFAPEGLDCVGACTADTCCLLPAPKPAPEPAAVTSCAGFVCAAPMTLRPQPEGLDCDGACTADTCCLLPEPKPAPEPAAVTSCAGFVCAAPMTLRPQPEGLDCDGVCTADTCCLVPERRLGQLAGADSSRRLVSKTHFRAATCAIEVKSSMKAMAKAVVNIMEVQKSCGDSTNWDCTNSGLSLISAFSSMATYIMGAVGHCSRIQFDLGIGCASAVTDIIGKLLDVSKASNSIHTECGADEPAPAPAPKPTVLVPTPTPVPQPAPTILVPTPVPTPVTAQPTILVPTPVPTPVPAPRLYAKDGSRAPRRASRNAAFANALKDNGPVTFTLAALLPITAIAAFFGGSRLARSRAAQSAEYEIAREIE